MIFVLLALAGNFLENLSWIKIKSHIVNYLRYYMTILLQLSIQSVGFFKYMFENISIYVF